MERRATASDGADATANPVAGWRSRSIALATLGAVSLSRQAFGSRAQAQLAPVALQILVAVTLQDDAGTDDSSGYVDGFLVWLMEGAGGEAAVEQLADAGLVQAQHTLAVEADETDEPDESWLALTELGAEFLESWLMDIAPLFTRWPPDTPADDAR